jgi:tetratricopeptide (TPR) repeat protein
MIKAPGKHGETQQAIRSKSDSVSGPSSPTKIHVLETRTSKPPESRFQRHRPGMKHDDHIDSEDKDSHSKIPDESDFCRKMLSDGYVNSFVDFYHLTHRADPHCSGRNIKSTVAELTFIRDNLVAAEKSHRQSKIAHVYEAYGRLADLYSSSTDWRTSNFFYEKCLEVSRLKADIRAEMAAYHSLGMVHQNMAEFELARKYHEKHEAVAKLNGVVEEVMKANLELNKVSTILARRLEVDGKFTDALQCYESCLESARKSADRKAEGAANGKIGNLLLSKGDAVNVARSVSYHKEQSRIAGETGNAEGECNSCLGLALSYNLLGQAEDALIQLSAVQRISEHAGDSFLQLNAYKALGTFYSKVGRLEDALDAMKKHYQLVNIEFLKNNTATYYNNLSSHSPVSTHSMNVESPHRKNNQHLNTVTVHDLDLARGYVGIAKGNLLMGRYMVSIQSDLAAILDWKLTRSELPYEEEPML